MSDTMLLGVLRMPYDLAMSSELSRRQFHDHAQEAAYRIEDDIRLLAWAYRKLEPYSFSKQDDALNMDEIKLLLLGA